MQERKVLLAAILAAALTPALGAGCGPAPGAAGGRPNASATSGTGARAPSARGTPAARPAGTTSAPAIPPALAAQGARLYTAHACGSCHGPQGAGTSAAPALNGTGQVPVLTTYPTPQALATFIHHNMPLTRPGSLTASEADALAAYIYYTLNRAAVPAGSGRKPQATATRPRAARPARR
ncbi:MAG: c-type cytochrome [Firmicutes bacterium]|nr:c-type cytochrome [Bacillota bacterium]